MKCMHFKKIAIFSSFVYQLVHLDVHEMKFKMIDI